MPDSQFVACACVCELLSLQLLFLVTIFLFLSLILFIYVSYPSYKQSMAVHSKAVTFSSYLNNSPSCSLWKPITLNRERKKWGVTEKNVRLWNKITAAEWPLRLSGLFSGSAPSRITAALCNFLIPPAVDSQVPIGLRYFRDVCFGMLTYLINLLIKSAYPPVPCNIFLMSRYTGFPFA